MAELTSKIIVSNSEQRPCIAHGKKAYFHRWADKAEIVPPSVLKGGHGGGIVRGVLAIVEYEDGTVGEVLPEYIRFIDHTDEREADNEQRMD